MINTKDFFDLSQLAEASYANFNVSVSNYDEALEDKGFSALQADTMLLHWTIIAHQPNTTSGFSSTLFKNTDGSYVLAIRGTEPETITDLTADIGDIAIDGIAIDQIVDLYNEWQHISQSSYHTAYLETLEVETAAYALAKAGQFVPGFDMAADVYLAYLRGRTDVIIDEPSGLVRTIRFETAASVGLGLDIDPGSLTVTGHSLGGHLAVAFTRLFPEMGAQAFTVNGAGFATGEISVPGLGGTAQINITNLFSMLGGATGFNGEKILNLYGDKNPEVVTRDGPLLFQQGVHEAIYIEHVDLLESALGHGGRGMTDSLAVYGLFFAMDASLQAMPLKDALARLKPIFEAASSDDGPGGLLSPAPNASLENLVNALADLFGAGEHISKDRIDDRDRLYKAIEAIRTNSNYDLAVQAKDFITVQPLAVLSREQIVAKAKLDTPEGLAYRYAITNLIPFAISGDAALYDPHNTSGELDLYDPATGAGALTERYLRDRAAMLAWQMQFNTDDIQPEGNTYYKFQGGTPFYFRDMTSDTRISIGGGYRLDMLKPLSEFSHVVFGSGNDDPIFGQGKNDWLYGGMGDDTLTGKGGNDYVEGGRGYDTYVINAGDGYDTILDADGQGVVTIGGIEAKGSATYGLNPAKWIQSGNVWQDQAHGIAYALVSQADGGQTLLIRDLSGSTVEIKDWSENELGITLGAGAAPVVLPLPTTSTTLSGDLKPADTDPAAAGVQAAYDDLGNIIVGTEADPGRADTLYDSAGNDRIEGKGGNDTLLAERGGDDILDGGAGDDLLLAYAGNDALIGGAGRDILQGGSGDDQLYGAERIADLAAYIQSSDTQEGSGAQGDWLSGGSGADTLVGDTGADVLLGGAGEDLLIGGAGDDYIQGDASGYAQRGWTLTREVIDQGDHTSYQPHLTDASVYSTASGEADVIYGGAGNDWINGNGGNDIVDGGADNDTLWGDGGDDVLLGGAGDDVLLGDNGYPDTEAGGNDLLLGGDGNDILWGNGGQDVLDGGIGDDTLNGGYGNDSLQGGAGDDTLNGGEGDDLLDGGEGVNTLYGGEGNDTLIGHAGDSLNGGAGDDIYIIEGQASVEIFDNLGTNSLIFNDASSLESVSLSAVEDGAAINLDLGNGQNIRFDAGFGTSIGLQTQGGDTRDFESWVADSITTPVYLINPDSGGVLYGAAGDDELTGGAGADILRGHGGNDTLDGGEGDDTLDGGAGADTLVGGAGNDTLVGSDTGDWLYGGEGDDTYIINGRVSVEVFDNMGTNILMLNDVATLDPAMLSVTDNGQTISLDLGNGQAIRFISGFRTTLKVRAQDGSELDIEAWVAENVTDPLTLQSASTGGLLYGGAGDDVIYGGNGDDILHGHGGDDTLYGGEGNDYLVGGEGVDTLYGGAGDDILIGSAGDILDGGEGNDTYIIDGQVSVEITDNAGSSNLSLQVDASNPTVVASFTGDRGRVSSLGFANGATISLGSGINWRSMCLTISGQGTSIRTTMTPCDETAAGGVSGGALTWRRSGTLSNAWGSGGGGGPIWFGSGGPGDWGHRIYMANYAMSPGANDSYNSAYAWFPRRDPLTLDLDGDGLETTGIDSSNPVLFDHDGDGAKNATGWVKPDDGFLVLDRNGNGTIDNGAELFGDSTPILDAEGNVIRKAADGFDALAQEDTNGDGLVNAQDANWANLRIWQDADSDGVTDAGELKTLGELGIAALRVAKTENDTPLPNGNVLADLGSFLYRDGHEASLGNVTGGMADIDLADNPFYREFSDTLDTSAVAHLPDMQGSGAVRDLREAASLSTDLAGVLKSYVGAATKAEQTALLDEVLGRWAATATFDTSVERATQQGFTLNYRAPDGADMTAWVELLETFNGMPFVQVDAGGVRTSAGQWIAASSMASGENGEAAQVLNFTLSSAQMSFMNQAYAALKRSVYDGLLLQTRLKPYMDGVGLIINPNGLAMDFSGVDAAFQARFDEAPAEAVRDLLDMQRVAGQGLTRLGWEGYGQLRDWLAAASTDPALKSATLPALADFGYSGFSADGVGVGGNEVVVGAEGGAVLNGNGGNDLVLGGTGDDTLNGGAGNDILYGGAGNDTYVFNLGDGRDTVIETRGDMGIDTLSFGPGILAGDLDIYRDGDNLVFAHGNGRDTLTISNWFDGLIKAAHGLDAVTFADGTTLDLNALQLGTSGNDTLTGTGANDLLAGGAGNDVLVGHAGDDLLHGGAGADTLVGGTGNDLYVLDHTGDQVIELEGEGVDTVQARVSHTLAAHVENLNLVSTTSINGTGNELDNVLTGNSGDNVLLGLSGNDTLMGGVGNDLLNGGAGTDVMAGGTGDDAYVVDTLEDTVIEQVGQGTDTVYTGLAYTLGQNLENLTLTGNDAVSGTGNELANVIVGNAADNTLVGLDGNDTLDGGQGADTMLGGTGDDIYVVDNVGDQVIENADEGIDLVKSSITYTLTVTTENLTLTGTANLAGTGNVLDNTLIGNSGDNLLTGLEGNDALDGGGGADTLLGGAGNDTYVVDNTGDAVIEQAGEGTDTVRSYITTTLAENVENLTLIGGFINGVGNELDNVLIGSSGDNVLDGGLGADSMAGGVGNDSYILDNLGDTVSEYAGQGTDTVISPFDYTLGANVENLALTEAALTGTGNELDNAITGTAADNTLMGLDGNDTLDGGSGDDTLIGGRGDDTYVVDSLGDTTVELAGEGVDTVKASLTWTLADNVENLILTGTETFAGIGNTLDNVITGNSAANSLTGLDGNDTLDGKAGADTLIGGTGSDTYVVDNAGDLVIENAGEGTDTVLSSITYTLTGNVENLSLTGSTGINGTGNELDNVITGNNAANTLTGLDGNDTLDGGVGADTLIGGTGDDVYIADSSSDAVVENADEGLDTVRASASFALSGNVENLVLTGAANINASGNSLDNVITGNGGDNVIDGGLGADSMAGGAGNDTYVVDDTGDLVIENANAGTDTVQSAISYTLTANVENLTLTGSADLEGTGNSLNNSLIGNDAANMLYGLEGNDLLIGGGGDDTLDGGAGADTMEGGAGNDTFIVNDAGDLVKESSGNGLDMVRSSVSYALTANVENLVLTGDANINGTGNALNNVITANGGVNTLSGLGGDDVYIVDSTQDVVLENAGEGVDTVISSADYALAANVENLILVGTAAINASGNTLDNKLSGNEGANTLDGRAGADAMSGGAGDDAYIVDNSGDAVIESAGEGTDTVYSSVSYTLSANVENLVLTGSASISGAGNELDNAITGNTGNNALYGVAGNDTLTGNSGNDILDGGTGADAMAGGVGNDIYVVDEVGDLVTENANEGTDLVQSSITYTLINNVENLTLTGTSDIDGTGNALDNAITGNSGNNVIDGGAGNDAMAGGGGNDIYIVDSAGDSVTEGANAGTDLVYSSVSHTLSANVENLTLTGTGDINGTGNNLNNILIGTTGNNRLDGSTGADSMYGGIGNDTYVVDNAGDLVVENADEGVDTVQSSISYTLTENVENLTLTGSSSINGTGNELDNVIVGNTGNNVLSGLAGNDTLTGNNGNDTLNGGTGTDTMAGGAGNDTYVVDDAGDQVNEALNAGTDLVQSSITYTLTANVENLTLTGAADIDGTGNTLNNVITGNAGANTLDGGAGSDSLYAGAGNDTLIGGDDNDLLDGGTGTDSMAGNTGNDTYVVDNVGDLVTEVAGEGTDLVQSSITYTLTDNVENLTLTGSANINGTGNELSNVIIGNSGVNTLYGLEGDDTLNGGSGADTMHGGVGNDTYVVDNTGDVVVEQASEGMDTVQSSVTYTLSANVENLTLTGSANINGTGNELDNVITGNTGNNMLSGLAGNDTLIGNSGNDTLNGGTGADSMSGNAGNDTYVVDDAGDVVTEGSNQGTDLVQSSITYTLTANVENLTLAGTADIDGTGNTLNNVITGNAGTNIIDGGAGNDTVNAGAGDDIILGGDGDDVLSGEAGADAISGGAGNDTLNGGLDADNMAGGTGNDTYVVDNVGDLVAEAANEGTDLVQSSITYTLTDNVENLTLTGSASINGTGNELANVITGNSGANILSGLGGNDTLNGNTNADTLIGGEGNDVLNSEAGADLLQGDAGNDTLNGGTEADSMYGGAGDDTYVVDNAGDLVAENADEGVDTVQSSISYSLTSNVENLTLTGSSSINGTGNELDNVIVGNTGNNVLSGLAGNDTLTGNSGNDILDGGSGADIMAGGAGNDTYVVDDAGDQVSEVVNAGTDTVQASIDYALGSNLENLTLLGTDDLNGTGNGGNNVITGNSGNNILDGGAGVDSLIGGAGDDTYVVDNTSDTITELANAGTDTVLAGTNYTLSANLENLTLTGAADISGSGNAGDNLILGNSGNNTLYGGAGNDVLDGGLGADTMQGGSGDDTFIVDNVGDVVVEAANAGVDTVRTTISYSLTANVENLVLEGANDLRGTGNALDNVLTGNGGSNRLDGGAGADTMAGGAGNDTYVVDNIGDVVNENAGEGTDTVETSASFALAANIENLSLTGAADINGVGNELGNFILGNGGNNTIDGGTGADAMAGGLGNDTYVVDNAGDTVVENADEGNDTVQSSTDYALGSNIENLVLVGAADLNGTGNALNNIIIGNSGNNLLDGGAGMDILAGGLGDDVYVVDAGDDAAVELAGEGTDTVQASVSYVLGNNIENLMLTGASSIDGTGNALDNTLTGNAGNNTLNGGAGNDVLAGGAGADLLLGGEGADVYLFNPGDGNDRVSDMQGFNTLSFGSGLVESSLEADRVGDDMVIHVLGSEDFVTLENWFTQSATDGINAITFDDGTVLDRTGIELLMNKPPVANVDLISVHEDGGPQVFPVSLLLANDTDPNPGDVISVVAVGESSVGASVALANGEITYDIGDRFQELAEGEVLRDSFSYTISDQEGATASGLVQVDIVGVNDAPVTGQDAAIVVEDWLTAASGNVLANDYDVDNGTVLQVGAPGEYAGDFGILSIQADGSYIYNLDNAGTAVQSLGRDALVIEGFGYTATDGITGTAETLDIFLHGTNDAPIVVKPLADQDFTFNKSFYWQIPADSFTDIDAGDALTYTATLADGSALPDWLHFDADTLTFSGVSPRSVLSLDIRVTATDSVAATGSTEGSLSAADVFTLSISHGNEGVGNGEDAAPAGQDSNFNDGAGTSTGNPGAKGGKTSGRSASSAAHSMTVDDGTETDSADATSTSTEGSDAQAPLMSPQDLLAYLGSSSWGQFYSSSSTDGADPATIFQQWLEMDLAISRALAEQQAMSEVDGEQGADYSTLDASSFLGSRLLYGSDAFSLLSSSGYNLQNFQGLSDGVQKIS